MGERRAHQRRGLCRAVAVLSGAATHRLSKHREWGVSKAPAEHLVATSLGLRDLLLAVAGMKRLLPVSVG